MTLAVGGEVLEPPRPQGAKTVSMGPGSNGQCERVEPPSRRDAKTGSYEPRLIWSGLSARPLRALITLVHALLSARSGRADNPDKVEVGKTSVCLEGICGGSFNAEWRRSYSRRG